MNEHFTKYFVTFNNEACYCDRTILKYGMYCKRIIASGLAAGVLLHIMQGFGAYFIFDRFYLVNPDLIRDGTIYSGFYFLGLNCIAGLAIAAISQGLKNVWSGDDWFVGIKAGLIIWMASSPVYVLKRHIIFDLSNWLILEIVFDLVVYVIAGAVAGFLCGRGIIDKEGNRT